MSGLARTGLKPGKSMYVVRPIAVTRQDDGQDRTANSKE
jgi:hypothetical protein